MKRATKVTLVNRISKGRKARREILVKPLRLLWLKIHLLITSLTLKPPQQT